jgi:hypothetical protein
MIVLPFSMQGEDIFIERTNDKCLVLYISMHEKDVMMDHCRLYTMHTIEYTHAKMLVSALEHQVS